jgi:hypothetical protein
VWQDHCMMQEMIHKTLGLNDRSNLCFRLGEMIVIMKMVIQTLTLICSHANL